MIAFAQAILCASGSPGECKERDGTFVLPQFAQGCKERARIEQWREHADEHDVRRQRHLRQSRDEAHDDTAETYIVISGGGTLVTGGSIVNGTRSAPDSEVTKILNGPSCSGAVVGATVSRKMGVGDISVIPAGVPHGWIGITDEVTYLSVRPDPKKVLAHGYVNPAIK